jgi:transketolase
MSISKLNPHIDIEKIASIAHGIRHRVLEHTVKNNGGYLSQACSSAEILACLYTNLVNLSPLPAPLEPRDFVNVPSQNFTDYITGAEFHGKKGSDIDRLFISPAHYALVIYAALIETGRLTEKSLEKFNKDGTTVEMIGAEHSPGFETTTGSLAQAISQAGGVALARKLRGESGKTWIFMSDGEFQEGQTWEALSAISFHELNNIRIIVDVNRNQVDGPMEKVMSIEPLIDRIKSFGWDVDKIDGNDINQILKSGFSASNKPKVILGYTDPTKGIEILKDRPDALHYVRFAHPFEKIKYNNFLKAWK